MVAVIRAAYASVITARTGHVGAAIVLGGALDAVVAVVAVVAGGAVLAIAGAARAR